MLLQMNSELALGEVYINPEFKTENLNKLPLETIKSSISDENS